ncbi:MAG: LptF/LptG family permease [Treponema sp.]|nr:LptF/LptG family permease [Treponema sp.]
MKKFIPVFLGALVFFGVILNVVDLLMNLWKYISFQVPMGTVLQIMKLYVPKTLWYSIPLAILFASSYCLSELYANNELLALFASGVSLLKFTLPMLIFSVFMSFALFVFDDKLVVNTYYQKTELQAKVLEESSSSNNSNVAVIAEGGDILYFVREYNERQHRIFTVYIVFRDSEKRVQSIIYSGSGTWNEETEVWDFKKPLQYDLVDESLVSVPVSEELLKRINEPYGTFRRDTVDIENIDVKNAKIYIDHLKRAGLPYNEELSKYYKKFSFPFIIFIVVFLSIGLTGKTKKNVLLMSLASSITAAVLFYVTQMVTMLMAQYGYISALSGAWSPVVLFVIISIVLLFFART